MKLFRGGWVDEWMDFVAISLENAPISKLQSSVAVFKKNRENIIDTAIGL